MRPADDGLIEKALSRLPIDERLAVAAAIEPKSRVQCRRLDERDKLIGEALAGVAGASLTARSCALERRLKRAARGHARTDELVHQVLTLNGGKTLGWQHLARIARAGRNPELCRNSAGIAQSAWAGSEQHEPV